MKKIYMYQKFERFWHWTQALLILFLALTGFEIHGAYKLFGFKTAVLLHDNAGIIYFFFLWIIWLWIFFSGMWRQLIPKKEHIKDQVIYYLNGIFKGEKHPTPKVITDKFNDLQRLTYFFLIFIILPLMVISGFIYLKYNYIKSTLGISFDLRIVSYLHIAIAFFLVAFVIGHIYLTTTGYKPLSAIKAMITGWEEMSDEEAIESMREYLKYSLNNMENKLITSKNKKDYQTFRTVLSEVANDFGITTTELKEWLEKANVAYFKINREGKYVEVNEIWKKIYDCTGIYDPIGKDFSLNFTGEDKVNFDNIFKQVMQGKALNRIKLPVTCKDGRKKYYVASIAPIIEGEQIVAIEGYFMDTQ